METQVVFQALFIPSAEGGFEVSFPQFPGCVTFSETFEKAQQAATEALGLWIEELQSHGNYSKDLAKFRPIIAEVPVMTT